MFIEFLLGKLYTNEEMKLEELSDLPWGRFGVQARIRNLFLTFHFVTQVALSSFFPAPSSLFF